MSNHLKRCGPIRQAAHAKRTALVEIFSDDAAANDGDLTLDDLAELDEFYSRTDASEPSAAQKAAREADSALDAQMQADARREWRAA